jgi:hypothetical protein
VRVVDAERVVAADVDLQLAVAVVHLEQGNLRWNQLHFSTQEAAALLSAIGGKASNPWVGNFSETFWKANYTNFAKRKNSQNELS